MKKRRKNKRANSQRPTRSKRPIAPTIESPAQKPLGLWQRAQRHWRIPFLVFSVPLGAIALYDNLSSALGGPLWPVAPDIHPHETTDGTSLILPFVVKDNSSVFSMPSVKLVCGVDLIWAEDSIGQTVMIRDAAFSAGVYSISSGGAPVNIPCDASQILRVNQDGTFNLGGSSTAMSSAKTFYPPWKILKMCVWIGGTYTMLGIIPKRFESSIFQWPAKPGSVEWLEGPVAGPIPKGEQIPGMVSDAYQCSPKVRKPYFLVDGPGPALYESQ